MQQINIEKEGNLLSIKAPWNPLFIEELKKLHGKWNPDEKVWTVNDFAQEQLNVAIRRVFVDILPRLKPWDSLDSGSIIQPYRLKYSHSIQDLC